MTVGDVEIDRAHLSNRGWVWVRMKRPLHAQSKRTEINYSNGWMDKTYRMVRKEEKGKILS